MEKETIEQAKEIFKELKKSQLTTLQLLKGINNQHQANIDLINKKLDLVSDSLEKFDNIIIELETRLSELENK